MKLKVDEAGKPVYIDGHPVYIADDGKEAPFDAKSTVATIARLNGEARTNRERYEAAEGKLKPFAAITDPEAAIKALNTVKNLDDKKLVDANQVEQIKAEAIKAVKAEYEPIVKERDTFKSQLYAEKIGGSFARSPLIVGEKAILAIPADFVQARFGQHFSIEDGKVVAVDASGNKIFSRTRPGELANFDEALGVLVEQYPQRDSILKGSGASGSGGGGGQGGGGGGKQQVTRKQFDAMSPAEQAKTAQAANAGTAVITD